MAKVRKVVGDQNSAEFDTLRRNFNTLLLMLENLGAMLQTLDSTTAVTVVAGMTEIGAGLEAAINDGADADITGTLYVNSTGGLEIAGVEPTPKIPRGPRNTSAGALTDMDPTNL